MNSEVKHYTFSEWKERFAIYEGKYVPLEQPMLEQPELNKPKRSSGPSKYVVYVKDPKTGNIKKINFGDAKGGLSAKIKLGSIVSTNSSSNLPF